MFGALPWKPFQCTVHTQGPVLGSRGKTTHPKQSVVETNRVKRRMWSAKDSRFGRVSLGLDRVSFGLDRVRGLGLED